MIMATPEFFDAAINAVSAQLVTEDTIKAAVKRILTVNSSLGLFDNDRYPDIDKTKGVIGCAEHRRIALECARESLVLLKNNGSFLPLNSKERKKIALIGPNADDYLAQLGDWVLGQSSGPCGKGIQPRDSTITARDGITKRFKGELLYFRGCSITPDPVGDKIAIPLAIENLKTAELGIIVVGDNFAYYGEPKPTGTLEMMGGQLELLAEVVKTDIPFVLVLINSKPLVIPEDVINKASAIIEQFNPGNMGGQALAEVLFGDYNPHGKLTISFPRCVGQQPLYYYKISTEHGTYQDITEKPTFAFGEGMNYNEFDYTDIHLESSTLALTDTLKVNVTLWNNGPRAGYHIIQVYIKDLITSCTWPPIQLKSFKKVYMESYTSKSISIEIPVQELFIVDESGKKVVEPGNFQAWVGPDSISGHLTSYPFQVVESTNHLGTQIDDDFELI